MPDRLLLAPFRRTEASTSPMAAAVAAYIAELEARMAAQGPAADEGAAA